MSDAAWRRRRFVLALVVAAVFALLASHRLHDNDLYWHLANGRSVLETRRIVVPETLAVSEFGPTVLAHQWPWDVLLYGVLARFGFTGVSGLVLCFAALAGIALVALASGWSDRRPRLLVVTAVAFVASPLVLTRLNERPETVAAVFWPCGLLLARWLANADSPRSAATRAVALVAFALSWAQVHLSVFAFVPAVVIIVGPGAVGWGGIQRARLFAMAGVASSTLATPYGLLSASVFTNFVRNPVGAYISGHINEWKTLRWEMLDPFDPQNVQGPAYVLLVVVAAVGAARLKRRALVEIALAALGVAVVAKGRRGILPAAFLTTPLAVATLQQAFGDLSAKARGARIVAAGIGIFVVVRMASWVQANEGALLRFGLDEGAFPLGAARWLDKLPGEHRALTTYRTGPTIGFETRGRVRGYVDSRTPHYFSEANLAAARAVWQDPRALPVAVERHRLDVAVVDRRFPVCATLRESKEWSAVLVEPAFTTFLRTEGGARPSPDALRRLAPCGNMYVDGASGCTDPAELEADIDRIAPYVTPAFGRYLRAERLLRCATGSFDGDAVAALIPPPAEASGFEAARDALEAWLLALAGRPRSAVALLEPHVRAGEQWVLADSLLPLSRGGADDGLRRLLEMVLEVERDRAPDAIVASLANACARLGDAACAHVAGARAAVVGTVEVAPALCFVRTAGATPEARADAEAWLSVLRRKAPNVSCER